MAPIVKLENCRKDLYQWDINQHVIVLDQEIVEIHYECNRLNRAIVEPVYEKDGERICNIPGVLLEGGEDIIAYAYVKDTNSAYTKASLKISVIKRKKPDNYTQVLSI